MDGPEDELIDSELSQLKSQNAELQKQVADLKDQLRWRKQSEERAPHGIEVLERFVMNGNTWVLNPHGEFVAADSEWLPVPP